MHPMTVAKKELQHEIEELSPESLLELKQFVQYLKFKEKKQTEEASPPARVDPELDPIFQIIGMAEAEPFADEIDEILYGGKG